MNDRAIGESNRYANDAYNRQSGQFNTNMSNDRADYGLAASRESDLYGRNQNYMNQLGNLATSGQNATFGLAGVGQNSANAIGNALGNNATNQANAGYYQAGSINNALQGGASNYMLNNYLNQPYGGGGGTNTYTP